MNAHMRSLWIGGAVLAAGAMATPALAEDPYELAWISQIGTSGHDISRSVALDSLGNVYISGGTTGNLAAVNVGGIDDLFLSKFDAAGNHLWSQQIGTLQSDRSYSVAIDGLGNPYISGFTDGNIAKPSNSNHDVVLIKYDSAGNHLWSQQIGTGNGDVSLSLAVDVVGNAWISGYSNGDLGGPNAGNSDAILAKFDAAGNHLWTQQFGTSSLDLGTAVAVDHLGNAYISGPTLGSLGGPNAGQSDAFLSKFDTDGNHVWSEQIGTIRSDESYGVAVDALGNAYISGWSKGDLGGSNVGQQDAILVKFDTDGNQLWSQQIGTSETDMSISVAVDGSGNAYISGWTYGDLGGPNVGLSDAFLSKFDAAGNYLWSQQIGTSSDDSSYSVAVDGLGNAWISGFTQGSLGGPNAGGDDAFVAKFSATTPIPLPSAAWAGLALLGGIGGVKVLRRRGVAG